MLAVVIEFVPFVYLLVSLRVRLVPQDPRESLVPRERL